MSWIHLTQYNTEKPVSLMASEILAVRELPASHGACGHEHGQRTRVDTEFDTYIVTEKHAEIIQALERLQ